MTAFSTYPDHMHACADSIETEARVLTYNAARVRQVKFNLLSQFSGYDSAAGTLQRISSALEEESSSCHDLAIALDVIADQVSITDKAVQQNGVKLI